MYIRKKIIWDLGLRYNNSEKKLMFLRDYYIIGVVFILLLSFALYSKSNTFAYASNDYSRIYVKNNESSNVISSNDAKFMNEHIIAGVNGSLVIMNLDRSVVAKYPEVKVNWIDSVDEDGLIVYGNGAKQLGIAKIAQNSDSSYVLISNNIINEGKNLMIDPTIIRLNDYYYITFTEVIGRVNNGTAFSENEASKVNGEYILHMWRAKVGSKLGDRNSWENVSIIQDNYHNTEDIDIMYSNDHFTVLFEYENYDKGCSTIKAIESLDSEGFQWGNPIELLPNDSDHEMASVWDEGDHYTLWYSSDKESVGKSYMAGKIYYAEYDKNWNLLSKDNEINGDYNDIGGVRLYEVNNIGGKPYFLYAKNYLSVNLLSVLEGEFPFRSEWNSGKWYDENGKQTYIGIISWKHNSKGWWIEDTVGWYPHNSWQKIDGEWYYFDSMGYMSLDEWRDGYWLGASGKIEYNYIASWKYDKSGWWYSDDSGWYPKNSWQKINGCWYYFDAVGYMVTNQYIDGYWIGVDGVCK